MIQSIVKAVRQVTSKIWPSKKYNRINWQNRPSTATALGATNLNKIDVFCNEVDNALIQIDAGKLDIATANSMLASVSFNQDTGTFTFKELDGTTYTYDLNLEKIPVSFTLSEDGILTMTTEDGTQWTCNIADLIKDYVFDDSDTIAFEKEFVEEDDEGKGSYHVTASVKAGSINETHLNPDYRSDILTYTTQAQTAANDSLTYSKDSKRWAVGDSEYEGSATDNAKYYKEQAEAAKQAAEEARDEAQAATGAVVMAPGVLGVGKPDNTTIEVALDGTISAKEATGTSPGISRPDGTTLGVEEGVMKMIADATSLLITDNQELVVEKVGDVAQKTTTQLLIDTIAQKVANELVTNSALTTTLANYVTRAMMSNVQVNDQNKVPTSSLAFSMNQAITELNSDFDAVGTTLISHPSSQFNTTVGQTYTLCELSLPAGKWLVIGACLATGNMYIGNADFGGTTRSYRANNSPEHTGIALAFSSGNKTVNLSLHADYIVSTVYSDPAYCYLRAIRIG